MTFPAHASINAYVVKNGVYGHEHEHSLPTVDALAADLAQMGRGAFLATVDISRAYKNFTSDPLDWPLLCFKWEDKFYCDLSMPFGARASSFHMQSVANCITDILALEGIICYMYLDDLVILSPDRATAERQYRRAKGLLDELGLPEAEDKAQPPARAIKWLGVIVNAENMTLSIPESKLREVIDQVSKVHSSNYISKKQLQSILGQLLFVAKCVRPARTFVSRLLTALRGAKDPNKIDVTPDMRKDLQWFKQFCEEWNGVAVITKKAPTKTILVDACLSGVGATDGQFGYGQQVAHREQGAANITELEAINVVLALHTFLTEKDRGTHIRVRCDNQAAVYALTTGRAHNPILQDCARSAWMVQALLGVEITYDHIPGKDNEVADALSRAHLSEADHGSAVDWVAYYGLVCIKPCLYFLSHLDSPLQSRPSLKRTTAARAKDTGGRAGPWHEGKPGSSRTYIHRIHGSDESAPPEAVIPDDLCIPGVCGGTHTGPGNNQKQALTCQDLPQDGWGGHVGGRTPQGPEGPGCLLQEQGIHTQGQRRPANERHEQGARGTTRHRRGTGSQGRRADNVLRSTQTVGDHPAYHAGLRPPETPNQSGLEIHKGRGDVTYKMGQEYAESRTEQARGITTRPGYNVVPGNRPTGQHTGSPDKVGQGPTADVPRHTQTYPSLSGQKGMGDSLKIRRGGHSKTVITQPQKGSGHGGPCKGLLRGRNPETWGMEVPRIQTVYRHPNWTSDSCPRRLYS